MDTVLGQIGARLVLVNNEDFFFFFMGFVYTINFYRALRILKAL